MEQKLNLFLMGKAGEGKSASGNSLLNKQYFKTSSDPTTKASEIEFSFTQFGKNYLIVVDGLRIENTAMDTVQNMLPATLQMDKALDMCYRGIDAFLFIIKFSNRFNANDKYAFDALKQIFGHSYLDHVIVVVTYGDSFEREMKEKQCEIGFHEWCRKQTGDFRQLYDDCQERFVLFNNNEKDEKKMQAQIQDVVQLARGLQNNYGRYIRLCFKNSERVRMKIIFEEKALQMSQGVKERLRLLAADRTHSQIGVISKFLLVGKTGVGKSATGNYLLNRPVFKTSESQGTQEVDYNFTHSGNDILMIVDTPGLGNISLTEAQDIETAAKHMETALAICCGVIDVFLFVIKFGNPFTTEDKTILETLKRIFGDSFSDHIIVVVTHEDKFNDDMRGGRSDVTFPEWCRRQTGEFCQLYDDCQHRFVLFNNKEKNQKKKETQIEGIVKLARELRYTYGHYTSQCFKDAERKLEKLILVKKAPQLSREIQETINLLNADIESLSEQSSVNEIEQLKSRIQNVRIEIDAQDKGLGVLTNLRELVEKVEQRVNNVLTPQSG